MKPKWLPLNHSKYLVLEEFNCKQSNAVPKQICNTVEIKPVKAAIIWIDSVIDLPKGD